MKRLIVQTGRLCDRYRSWRETRRGKRLKRPIDAANDPKSFALWHRENEKNYGRLFLDDEGFFLAKAQRCKFALKWSDVRTIETYKVDCWIYDTICLAFEIGDDRWIEVFEEMIDFDLVRQRMLEVFPAIDRDWYTTVMLPAFATNQAVLWRRDASGSGKA